MVMIEPTGKVLGATVTGIDLSAPISHDELVILLRALGDHGVLRLPDQLIDARQLRDFSLLFGRLQQSTSGAAHAEPGMTDVSILSNVKENGRFIGVPDAGQDWHTDMTYNQTPGFVNVLVAHKVPMRDGKPLGATQFTNTQAAYEGLPADVKAKLEGMTATHDINKYWEEVRRNGSPRPPLTPEQRAAKPPAVHPVILTHPISGRKVIYVNPGFTERIHQLPQDESDAMLQYLFDHILKPEYRYVNHWTVGDVLLWDHLGTWHYAIPDYRPDEERLMKRCQVMADKIFDPEFQRAMIGAPRAA